MLVFTSCHKSYKLCSEDFFGYYLVKLDFSYIDGFNADLVNLIVFTGASVSKICAELQSAT